MGSPRITFTYTAAPPSDNEPIIALEQEAVPSGKLSPSDLANMLSLVRSGISAVSHIVQNCPASLVNGKVLIPLTVYAWPSVPDLDYALTPALPAWTTMDPPKAIEQARDFDLVLPMVSEIALPCLAADLEITWQTPAITDYGVVIDPPLITGYDPDRELWAPVSAASGVINKIRLAREVFGVLRVQCRAVGFQHDVTMAIPKDGTNKISGVKETLTAAWTLTDGKTLATETINLTLPGCAAALLEICPDDPNRTPGMEVDIGDEEDLIPELRYSTCDGLPIGNVRYIDPGEKK